MGWLDGITDWMNVSSSKLQEMVMTGKPGVLQSMGSQRVGHDLATEQQQHHSIVSVCRVLFIHSSVAGHLACLHVLL